MSILSDALPGARVLDLFAGSGAAGLEALSRGAAHATFVERDKGAAIWRGVIQNAAPKSPKPQEENIWVPGPWRDPALLEWQRGGRFELRVFPIPAHGARDDVEVAVGDRVERAGIDRDRVHRSSWRR